MSKASLVRLGLMSILIGSMAFTTACGKKQQVSDPEPYVEQQMPAEEVAAPVERSITLYQYRFNPQTLTIPAGSTVTFENRDPERHNISIPALNVDHNLDPNQSWSYVFETRGEFAVSNRFASNPMQLTIVVE